MEGTHRLAVTFCCKVGSPISNTMSQMEPLRWGGRSIKQIYKPIQSPFFWERKYRQSLFETERVVLIRKIRCTVLRFLLNRS